MAPSGLETFDRTKERYPCRVEGCDHEPFKSKAGEAGHFNAKHRDRSGAATDRAGDGSAFGAVQEVIRRDGERDAARDRGETVERETFDISNPRDPPDQQRRRRGQTEIGVDVFEWADPPDPGIGRASPLRDALLPLIEQLRSRPGRWARLREYDRLQGAASAKQRAEKLFPDVTFTTRKREGGSTLWGCCGPP